MALMARAARREDEPELLRLLIDLHRNNGAGWGFPYSLDLVQRRIEAATRPNRNTRTHIDNFQMGSIGVVGPVGGPLTATVGLFIEPFFWYSTAPCLVETWLYVVPSARRHQAQQRALFSFSNHVHQAVREGWKDPTPFPLMTGFVNMTRDDGRLLERFWRIMSGARKCGVLFFRN